MKVIFGLGNPGQAYKKNRHNVGYMVAESLAGEAKFRKSLRLSAFYTRITISGQDVLLIKPRTYMNDSGRCVRKVVSYYKVKINDILVVYDEIDLMLGEIRLRAKGSSGGHRGMGSIVSSLGDEGVNRLRLGISGNRGSKELSDYVLDDFSSREEPLLEETLALAKLACFAWVGEGIDFAMQQYNGKAV
ncbi:MAG: aminoacyl-tRNA hydrolase [Candidatus Omnitrophica bacterium]|nr:aminoacyl-tRNA hydrolase [Candidatus Omnitrophota bacterium]MDD5429847.1 aminoacyl-tRNA hydrolase [Candidatus Omnitrophota bacterium]